MSKIPKPCSHLAEYKLKHGINNYTSLQNSLKTGVNGETRICASDQEIPRCFFCDGYHERLYLCLVCSSIACLDHSLLHIEASNGHNIVVNMERSELYCVVCRDQVYDSDFDKVVITSHLKKMYRNRDGNDGFDCGVVRSISSGKRKNLGGLVDLDVKKLRKIDSLRDLRAKSCYPFGLRGLNNLGSTCFMNSVLQAFLHAPLLKNYFLSDRHDRETCRKRSCHQSCLICEIDVVFSAVFSGERSPYSPAQFLYSWWQHSGNLASYEEQDAHEFFISVLDRIHEKEGKTNHLNKGEDCHCISHRAFSGLLRSDVTCMACGYTSTKYDPCMDISLHLGTIDKGTKLNETLVLSTLTGCLDLFTRAEKLGSDQKLHCENCQERQDSMKQLSFGRLPKVLCLHIKRFEHSFARKTSKKLDWYLQFPFSLDMKPYLWSSIVRRRLGNRIFPLKSDEYDCTTEYEIFAVITHSGILESGHYVTFLRLRNQWYRCDDAWITEVDEGTVRASQCYMIFYAQKSLYYTANEDPGCLPVSSARDELRPIVGCC